MVTHEDIATGLLDRYHEIGARHIVAIAREPDFDLADLRRLLAWRDSLSIAPRRTRLDAGGAANRGLSRPRMPGCERLPSPLRCVPVAHRGRVARVRSRRWRPRLPTSLLVARCARRRRGRARRALRPLRPRRLRARAAHRARRDAGRGRRAGGLPRPLARRRALRSRALAARELPAHVRPPPRRRPRAPRAGPPAARRRRRRHRGAPGQGRCRRPRSWPASRARACAARSPGCPPPQRQVLELAYFNGLSQSEIAERLGEPLGTVKSRTHVALSRLRELLGEGFHA